MKKLTYFLFAAALLFSCKDNSSNADQGNVLSRGNQAAHLDRYEQSIQAFEQADAKEMPPKGAVLFTGSSSIRKWETLAEDFAPVPVINRGFGGATLPEVMHYAERIVYKYEPKLMVLYAGENDIKEDAAPAVAFQNLKKFIGETEKNLAGTQVIFISAKPSPARWGLWKNTSSSTPWRLSLQQPAPTSTSWKPAMPCSPKTRCQTPAFFKKMAST